MQKPSVSVLTFCDYAEIYQDRMSVLRTFSYFVAPVLPSPFAKAFAMRLHLDDMADAATLVIKVMDHEGTVVVNFEVRVTPQRTVSEQFIIQLVANINFTIQKSRYDVEVRTKENGALIASLALPIVVQKSVVTT